MNKVYVLTSGWYDDRHIHSVYSSEELAYVERAKDRSIHDEIEVYELDQFIMLEDSQKEWTIGNLYFVKIMLETGKLAEHPGRKDIYRHPTECETYFCKEYKNRYGNYEGHIDVKSPISLTHAKEVAIKLRQEYRGLPNFTSIQH